MIKEYLNEHLEIENKKDKNLIPQLNSIASNCVILCHNYIKNIYEIPISNLKEVNKSLAFFNIFSKYLFSRNQFLSNNNELNNEIEFYKDKKDLIFIVIQLI